MSKLLILGAGQYSRVVYEIAQSLNIYEQIDFLDDANEKAIGKISQLQDFAAEYTDAIVAIGNCEIRLKLLASAEAAGYRIPTLISPFAYVSKSAKILGGTVIEPMAVVNPNAVIGKGCLICAGAVVNHDAIIEDSCQVNCNAVVNSGAVLTKYTRLNCCCVRNKA